MMLDLYLALSTELNAKCTKDLNIRAETIDLLEENTQEKLHDLAFGNDFLYMTPEVWCSSSDICSHQSQ